MREGSSRVVSAYLWGMTVLAVLAYGGPVLNWLADVAAWLAAFPTGPML